MAKNDKDGRDNHSGSTAAEDDEFTIWLNKLWARNEPPERLEVWQAFGRNGLTRGELIHHEDFKHGEKLDVEHVNKLANEIMSSAQHDCDSRRRESSYQIAVVDRNRKASPLVRRLGPMQPKRSYMISKASDLGDEDDEESEVSASVLNQRSIKEGLDQDRWNKQRYDRVMDGMLLLQNSIITELRADRAALMSQQMSIFQQLQEAEDRRTQREVVLEKERFKIGLMKDGVRTARNLLPALFGNNGDANGSTNGVIAQQSTISHDNGHSNGAQQQNGTASKTYGSSPERTLVGNFINDCEELGEQTNVLLFGDFVMRDGKMVPVTPGIFTLKQYWTFLGVRDGGLPASALDNILPNSGHVDAITQEQIIKAGEAGVTEGMGTALLEIVALRQQARQTENNGLEK